MTTLDKHADVSVELALQLEGQAIMADVSTEEYLQEMLDKFGPKVFKTERTKKLQEYIRKRHAEGATDSQIAREKGMTQQNISRQRNKLGLPRQKVVPWGARVTHCPQGHEYTKENTYRPPSGGRKCRTCSRIRDRNRRRPSTSAAKGLE